METYLVGGAVRDLYLGLTPKDLDYVVVNSSPAEMLQLGFTKVGGHFPVFLHPETKEEYALARTETSTGDSYHDFTVNSSNVTLEEDLLRRDLTINAIAYDNGEYIDPYGGINDIDNKVLRHVSEAFIEDPIRILRVARFHARMGYEWTIHPSTIELCKQNVNKIKTVSAERISIEFIKAFNEPHTELFLSFLSEIGAECVSVLTSMFDYEQSPIHHPEGNVGIHTLRAVKYAELVKDQVPEKMQSLLKWGVFLHDFGKPLAYETNNKKHYGKHEYLGKEVITQWNETVRLPNSILNFGILCSTKHTNIHNLFKLKPVTLYKLIDNVSLVELQALLIVSAVDSASRYEGEVATNNFINYVETRAEYLMNSKKLLIESKRQFAKTALSSGKTGCKVGEYIRQQQIQLLHQHKEKY